MTVAVTVLRSRHSPICTFGIRRTHRRSQSLSGPSDSGLIGHRRSCTRCTVAHSRLHQVMARQWAFVAVVAAAVGAAAAIPAYCTNPASVPALPTGASLRQVQVRRVDCMCRSRSHLSRPMVLSLLARTSTLRIAVLLALWYRSVLPTLWPFGAVEAPLLAGGRVGRLLSHHRPPALARSIATNAAVLSNIPTVCMTVAWLRPVPVSGVVPHRLREVCLSRMSWLHRGRSSQCRACAASCRHFLLGTLLSNVALHPPTFRQSLV
jgi:hypothetical protein